MPSSFVRAGIILSIGACLFVAALWKSFHPPEEDTRDLATSVEKLRLSVAESEASLNALRVQNDQLSRDLTLTRTSNQQSAENVEKRRIQVRSFEEENLKRIGTLRNDAQKLETETLANTRNKEALLIEKENQANFQASLLKSTGAVATIASPQGEVASGCMLDGDTRPLIFTVLPPETRTEGLLVKLNLDAPNSNVPREYVFLARPVHFDRATGLTVLTIDQNVNIRLKLFKPELLVEAKLGEKVYMIGSQVLGTQILENNIYEGSISATNRVMDNGAYLQVAMPGNFGMKGAPLFNTKRELVGILKGAVDGLERTTIAIPAADVQRVLKLLK